LHDISQRLRPALPVWPGDVPFDCAVTASVSEGASVTLHRFSLSTQSGTHAECELRDVSFAHDRVGLSDVIDRLPARVERVLLRTMKAPDWNLWPGGFTAIAPDLIDALAARGCRLIGTDAPSIDPETCKALRSHHAAHRAGMAILEGLVLDGIAEGRYELIALPLPIEGIEATPVRAVLRELSNEG
jgi:arylformamidase